MRLMVSSLLFVLVGCNGQPPPSLFNPKLYNGDSEMLSLIGSDEIIKCQDEKFDSMICMDKSEIANIVRDRNRLIEACAQWKQ